MVDENTNQNINKNTKKDINNENSDKYSKNEENIENESDRNDENNENKNNNKNNSKTKLNKILYWWKIVFYRTIGNFLIFSSLFMLGKTFYQPVVSELNYYIDSFVKTYIVEETTLNTQISKPNIQISNYPLSTNTKPTEIAQLPFLPKKRVEIIVPENPDFGLIIPKIGANTKIFENVDPTISSEYLPVLKEGVAHAKNTGLPGSGQNIFLFAHSTDYIWNVGSYNAVFYLLYKLNYHRKTNFGVAS